MSVIRFTLNGEPFEAAGVDPHTTLLNLLRDRGLTGTKEGCAEGECGACAVVLVTESEPGQEVESRYLPVNSCLLLAAAADGQELWTVEGLRDRESGALHPAQEAMARGGGSQCGYCTPGFVMSMFAEYYREGREAGPEGYDPEAIGGNLCRCTGYRPIRDALVSLRLPREGDPHLARLAEAPPRRESFSYQADGVEGERRFYRPSSLEELFTVLESEPEARIISGGTDLVVELNQLGRRWPVVVSVEAVKELHAFDLGSLGEEGEEALVIGAAVRLSDVERRCHGRVPIFDELFPLFSSRLIRNRATLGGNLVNASPIGDSPPALLALDAELTLASKENRRTVPLSEFFTGYRQTVLRPGEIVESARIPLPLPSINRFYKVSKRVHDDISTVAAGFGIRLDTEGRITSARLAYGGVAATPARATAAEAALIGKTLGPEALEAALPLLEGAFTPMDDHRGSARYRAAMVVRLFEKLVAESQSAHVEAAE